MVSALVKSVRAGKQEEISLFYRETWNELNGHFKIKGVSIADAEDIFQDAFLLFINTINTKAKLNHCSRKECKMYLTGIVKIKVKEFFRKGKDHREKLEVLKQDFISLGLHEADTDEEKINLVAEKMHEIDDTCREILRLYYFERLSPEVILKRVDNVNSLGSLKVKKHRCLKKLRKLVHKNGVRKKQDGMD